MSRRFERIQATGVGSLPGTDVREAVRVVFGELDVPHIPELPQRGPGADLVGRGLAMLVDLTAEWGAQGWHFADSPGADMRRGRAWLREDLDALEELGAEWRGPVKVQVCGPWTLLAETELPSGRRAVSDEGAVREVVQSLAEGVGLHLADLRRRIPHAQFIVAFDEPSLPAVLDGALPTPSGRGRVAAVEESIVQTALSTVFSAAFEWAAGVAAHCCAGNPPVELLWRSGAGALSVDLVAVGSSADQALGTILEAGGILMAGVVPSTRPSAGPSDVGASVALVSDLFRRLGLSIREHDVVVTPTCGLAGADAAYAREAMRWCREVARRLDDTDE
ncbi:MAG: methionine synthase [Candidatus Nanopelagicales bacterium]